MRSIILFLGFFMAFAHVLYAQPAMNSIANTDPAGAALPLRNLQIEVRQLRRDALSSRGAGVDAQVQLGSDGRDHLQGSLQAQDTLRQQSTTATQQVLVLNGRSAFIALRTSTPLRLMQSFYRNGLLHITRGTVLLEAGTGFMATPSWDGSGQVMLELAAQQAASPNTSSGIGSSVLLPLGEWVTVAQSEQSSNVERNGLGGGASQSGQTGLEVQVRLTVR